MKLLFAVLCAAGLLTLAATSSAGGKSEAKGVLTLGDQTYKLASALAYETTVFNKKETVIILSEKPLDTAKLKQSFKKNGNDDDFFPVDTHVKLSFDDRGELLQLHIQAGGGAIIRSGDNNIKTTATIKDGTAKGTARTVNPGKAGSKTFQFEATFDVKLTKP